MLDTILQFIPAIVGFLGDRYGQVGMVMGYLIVGIPMVNILIELLEFIVALTASTKDDEFAAKVRAVWSKVLPVMEILPHTNIPLSAGALKVIDMIKRGVSALKGMVQGWFGSKPQP